jgi:hypothetical protein
LVGVVIFGFIHRDEVMAFAMSMARMVGWAEGPGMEDH